MENTLALSGTYRRILTETGVEMMSELSVAERSVARHIIAHCLEGDVDDHTPDDVDWSYREWTVQTITTEDDGTIEVHATQDDTQAEKVASATRHQPAEYEYHSGTIHLIARANWSDDPLAGECHANIDFEGGRPSPPDIEGEWRDV
jgi:hypothetical protein